MGRFRWSEITLRKRIYVVVAALVFITFAGGVVMIWYTYRMDSLLTAITDENLAALEAAEDLQTALANQKGFVTYFFLDGDPDWLRQLGEYRQIFKTRLDKARNLAATPEQQRAIRNIESEYNEYIALKDDVILLYKSGKSRAGANLHKEVRNRFFNILNLCQAYKDLHYQKIFQVEDASRLQAFRLRSIAAIAIFFNFLLAVFLSTIIIREILGPIRKLAQEMAREGAVTNKENVIKILSRRVYRLLENMDYTRAELEKSRENLLQAEKMASVGKLAAGMAHSIRNPFTSVKMRLFSLGRSLGLDHTQQEDFDVISEEIRHIDTIIQNFLEFSRPPKLAMQSVSPSTVVDMTLQLLEHRLKSYDVSVRVVRDSILPPVQADPEQIKEVLVNLIINACEAMPGGGSVAIEEKTASDSEKGRAMAVIRVADDGPGIAPEIQDKILEPFFTTKEEGTGLGLSIARRIISEHNGDLAAVSGENRGTTFIITLPLKEQDRANHPHHR